MIGIDIGSLNTVVSIGQSSNQRFKSEVILSDVSSRTMPSLISYTDHHRLIGDQANLKLKKYSKSSFNNLNRLIGLCPNSPFASQEFSAYYLIGSDFNPQKNLFTFKFNGREMIVSGDTILTALINKIKQYYITEQKNSFEIIVFSCPDYYTQMQKDALMRACKACDFDKCHIINESTAITLYYGYNRYKELFRNEQVDSNQLLVDPNMVKYIFFIDSGHSKTTFICSQFNYAVFKVINVLTLPFFGGRNLDERIFNLVAMKFKAMYKIDITKNAKAKMRVLEVVTKARKILTVNKDASISIESLCDDYDFSYLLSRAEYEDLIKEDLIKFKDAFEIFYKESMSKMDLGVTTIEMAGELMRTPCLQTIIKDVTQKDISKGILTDECISIGSSIYGAILQNCLPLLNFQGIYHFNTYSIYYTMNHNMKDKAILIKRGDPIPNIYTFELNDKMLKSSQVISFQFYSDPNEVGEIIGNYCNNLLIDYEINTTLLTKLNLLNGASVFIDFLVHNSGKSMINAIKRKDPKGNSNDAFIPLQVSKDVLSIKSTGQYNRESEEKDMILRLKKIEQEHITIDNEYREYCSKKNSLAGEYYKLKNALSDNEKAMTDQTGRPIIDRLYSIEKQLETPDEVLLQSNGLMMTEQKIKDVSRIISNKSSSSMNSGINNGSGNAYGSGNTGTSNEIELMNRIMNYQKKINDRRASASAQKGQGMNKEALDFLTNILNRYKFKASQCKTNEEMGKLLNEFNIEISKYPI